MSKKLDLSKINFKKVLGAVAGVASIIVAIDGFVGGNDAVKKQDDFEKRLSALESKENN